MENKHIIIILLIVIIVLSAAIAAALFNPLSAKETSKINITSNSSQYDGGEISILLSDLNDTPISKQIVNITVTDDKGKIVVDDVVKTDSKGKAKLDLELEKGEYVVNVSYGGNENYTGNSTTQKLTIKEEVVESETDYSSSDEYVYSNTIKSQANGTPIRQVIKSIPIRVMMAYCMRGITIHTEMK